MSIPESHVGSDVVEYLGAETAAGYPGQFDGAPVGMARIAVRPEWVGLLDFSERLPGPLGGVQGPESQTLGS